MSMLNNSVIYKLVIAILSVFFSISAIASPSSDAEILTFESQTIPAEGSTIFDPVKFVRYSQINADIAQAQVDMANEDEIDSAQYQADIAQAQADIAKAQAYVSNEDEIYIAQYQAYIAKMQADIDDEDDIYIAKHQAVLAKHQASLAQYQAILAEKLATSMKSKNTSNSMEILAEQGNAKAQYLVGASYLGGFGVLQDYKKAFEWYQKAANQGNVDAQNGLGRIYLEGNGVRPNKAKAKEIFGKTCVDGDQVGCYNYRLLNQK